MVLCSDAASRGAAAARAVFAAGAIAACSPSAPPTRAAASSDASANGAAARAAPLPSASAAPSSAEVAPPAPAEASTAIGVEAAHALLFPKDDADARDATVACHDGAAEERIRCMLRRRYAADEEARGLALGLYDATGDVAGLEPEGDFDGGWRGKIHFAPELPIGPARRHLVDVAAALEDFDAFVADVSARAPRPVRYRMRDLGFRFFRSVGRTTPSAFAERWSIGYNLSGSLLGSADGVRETLVHELFHLNDERGDGAWSERALGPTFDAIVARCGTNAACLAPFAPNDTMVKGGTFYAFQPGGGVREYAAELAVRYVKETRAALVAAAPAEGQRSPHGREPASARAGWAPLPVAIAAQGRRPFRCARPENARAWSLLVEEFFGGVDVSAACGPAAP